ncbi:DUF2889 domain-containing protein [Comamonas jiangduensis]|uniref:DUF2889 domain-containing protein n=1 Tax=Comamonas jiangduensis TaxID=1194168 RepID=UPI001584207A|nr:DUF2889 domain-containing protein [Comamonas jiangduensis]QXW19384.1 DUF2889 domain-containing protein [Comamonas aquatica]
MPLSTPTVARTPQHIRQVNFRSYERADGLWDIEGELLDTKAIDLPRPNGEGIRKAGDPIHHMHIRVTVNTQLVVQAIEASMEAHPVQGCPAALDAMQRMVGCSMARGWRKSIDANLAGVAGCTHMRELLQNMATAAFQSIVSAFNTAPDQPPAYLGRCTGWSFNGPAVAQYHPQFVGWIFPEGKSAAQPPVQAEKV